MNEITEMATRVRTSWNEVAEDVVSVATRTPEGMITEEPVYQWLVKIGRPWRVAVIAKQDASVYAKVSYVEFDHRWPDDRKVMSCVVTCGLYELGIPGAEHIGHATDCFSWI
jgi:hypothetical protein